MVGNVDFANLFLVLKEGVKQAGPYASVAAAKQAGAVTMNIGLFINSLVSFTIVAFAIFMLVKAINRLKRSTGECAAAPATKECRYCLSSVPLKATAALLHLAAGLMPRTAADK
jgi:large conductance mechanosensitive channel